MAHRREQLRSIPICCSRPTRIAADRFAREIVRIVTVAPSALVAAECQSVGPPDQ
jgi:hypothetical protein